MFAPADGFEVMMKRVLLGLLLCWAGGFGVVGLWTGLALGLVSVALMLLRAWRRTALRMRESSGRSLRHLKERGSWTSRQTAACFFLSSGNSQKSRGSTRQPGKNGVAWNGSMLL